MTGGIIGFIVSLSHKTLELPFSKNDNFQKVIELGAGNCEHLPHVKHQFAEYTLSDIRTELLLKSTSDYTKTNFSLDTPLFVGNLNAKLIVSNIDAQNLSSISDNSFDRLISFCLILHLEKPEIALLEWRRIIKKGGVLSIYIHCEPGLLLRFSRSLSTVIRGRRIGVNHLHNVYREHKLSFLAIKHLIYEVFTKDEVKFKSFPFPFLSWNFSLFKIVQIRLNK